MIDNTPPGVGGGGGKRFKVSFRGGSSFYYIVFFREKTKEYRRIERKFKIEDFLVG
jgi:hypothetical protein